MHNDEISSQTALCARARPFRADQHTFRAGPGTDTRQNVCPPKSIHIMSGYGMRSVSVGEVCLRRKGKKRLLNQHRFLQRSFKTS
jgi:hypothetical protein